MAQKNVKIETDIWRCPYEKARAAMESEGFTEISMAVFAKVRMEQGKDAYCCERGNWTSADVLLLPGKKPRLTKGSIMSAFPKEVSEVTQKGEFYIDGCEYKEAFQKAMEDSVELILTEREVAANALHESPVMVYALGTTNGKNPDQDKEDARLYGEFLLANDITKVPFNFPDAQSRPYARKVWFRNTAPWEECSAVHCALRDMRLGNVRGVREVPDGVSSGILPDELTVLTALSEVNTLEKDYQIALRRMVQKYSRRKTCTLYY